MKAIPGIDNFKEIIERDYYYVDKTKAIEDLLVNGAKVTLYTRPRRFGKSLLISTLDNFFNIEKIEENKDLFNDLYISKSEYYNYFGKYPVIRLDFKDLKGESYDAIYEQFKTLMSKTFLKYEYILDNLTGINREQISIRNCFRKIKNYFCQYWWW